MNIILFAQQEQETLLPLTFLKPTAELRMGILTFRERWEHILPNAIISHCSPPHLAELFPSQEADDNIFIHSCYFPNQALVTAVQNLKIGEGIVYKNNLIAGRGSLEDFKKETFDTRNFSSDLIHIQRPFDLFTYNDMALNFDFELLTKNRESQKISETNGVINPDNIFLEEGSKVEFAILNASSGPIYVGKNAEICEGSLVRGGLALCEHAKLNMGSKIYGATTIGPWCKVGGEVNNSILTAYSNKGHDGFLGNSVIGEWCNLGADTNNSNLKNNYGKVKLWNYTLEKFENTDLQFCGLIMGDHSKSAINTQFNTGTVTGIFANIFKPGFPPNKIKSFTWGGSKDSPKFNLSAAYEVADRMMQRRGVTLSDEMKQVIAYWYHKIE